MREGYYSLFILLLSYNDIETCISRVETSFMSRYLNLAISCNCQGGSDTILTLHSESKDGSLSITPIVGIL